MEEIIVRVTDLPHGIVAVTLLDEDWNYNIYLNARMNTQMQRIGYKHELEHIRRGDWGSPLTVAEIEREVRSAV